MTKKRGTISTKPKDKLLLRGKGLQLVMRDRSCSYVFDVNDKVCVVSSVMRGDKDLKGTIGIVKENWSKCEVDPTCCCAEQVDENMAVLVEFDGGSSDSKFSLHFGEDELSLV